MKNCRRHDGPHSYITKLWIKWSSFKPWPLVCQNVSHLESHRKISNVMITQLFYSLVLYMNRGSLHTRSFRHIQLLVLIHRLIKNGSADPECLWGFQEMSPGPLQSNQYSRLLSSFFPNQTSMPRIKYVLTSLCPTILHVLPH